MTVRQERYERTEAERQRVWDRALSAHGEHWEKCERERVECFQAIRALDPELFNKLESAVAGCSWYWQDYGSRFGALEAETYDVVDPLLNPTPEQFEERMRETAQARELLDEAKARVAEFEDDEELMDAMEGYDGACWAMDQAQRLYDTLTQSNEATAEANHGGTWDLADTLAGEIASGLGWGVPAA